MLFGDTTGGDAGGAQAAALPGHVAFVGQHTHAHSDYQRGDTGPGQHVHPHTHMGDATHDHHSAGG